MSKHLPPKPEFYSSTISMYGGVYSTLSPVITQVEFDQWYDKTFANAVEAYGCKTGDTWGFNDYQTAQSTHAGLVVRLQPIEEETAEDLLREAYQVIRYKPYDKKGHEVFKRIDAYLAKLDANKKGEK